MPPIRSIQVPGTRAPVGHYSQAIAVNGLVFVSGQIPINLETGALEIGTIEEQAELVLTNTGRILEAAGSSLANAVQITIYLNRMDDWGAVNAIYSRLLGAHRPARAVVPVPPLHYGAGIEIQCIATSGKPRQAKPTRKTAGIRKPGKRS
jgi:2-iminobutanoate/2-iminopropanoate deaminase